MFPAECHVAFKMKRVNGCWLNQHIYIYIYIFSYHILKFWRSFILLAESPGSGVVPLDATHASGRHADGATPHAGKRQLGGLEGPLKAAVSFTASGSSFVKN